MNKSNLQIKQWIPNNKTTAIVLVSIGYWEEVDYNESCGLYDSELISNATAYD